MVGGFLWTKSLQLLYILLLDAARPATYTEEVDAQRRLCAERKEG